MIEFGGDVNESSAGDVPASDLGTLKRVCLIDYGSTGPGPRGVDTVALQASVRLADAQHICEAVTGHRDLAPKGEALAKALELAANRVHAEKRILNEAWAGPSDQSPGPRRAAEPWDSTARLLTKLLRLNFDDEERGEYMERDEYLAIAVPCAIRQCSYDISQVARMRLLAWLSALYGALGSPVLS
jgi:hypothetical protein